MVPEQLRAGESCFEGTGHIRNWKYSVQFVTVVLQNDLLNQGSANSCESTSLHPPAPAPLAEGLKMVPKCNGKLNRVSLKTLLSLEFRVGKQTGPARATDSGGRPALWISGPRSLFHNSPLFYFLCPDSYKSVFYPLFAKSQINTTSPKPDSVVCVGCRPEHILAFLVAKVKNISVCS